MRSGRSSGVCTYTQYQSELSRPAMRLALRSSTRDSGGSLDMQAITRSTVLRGWRRAAVLLASDDRFPRPVHRARDLAKRELAERREVLVGEEVRERGLDLVLAVDLPFTEPLAQVFGRDVQVHDLVGLARRSSRERSRGR